jgi:uncharacterized membrane protein
MGSSKNKVAHFNGVSFALLIFSLATAGVISFITVGGIFSLIDVKKMQIPIYFSYFDWIPAVFLFLLGVSLAIQSKNKSQSVEKLKLNSQRKGALLLVIGLAFVPAWGINIFIIIGASYLISSMLIRMDSLTIHAISLAIILCSLVLVNVDIPFRYKYFVFDVQTDGVAKLMSFVFFNGYYSVFPWVASFLSGMAVGKGVLRPRGFFPPTSFIALFIVILGFATDMYCVNLYTPVDAFVSKFLFPFNNFMYQPSFILISIGLGWIITNFLNHCFELLGPRVWIDRVKDLSTSKYTLLLLMYILGSLYMAGFAVSGTIVIGFAYPILLLVFILMGMGVAIWTVLVWKRKVSKYAPIEWVIKYISTKDNSNK